MESLEETLKEDISRKEEIKSLPIKEKPLYEGLKKLEESNYSGPTSIKYWM